MGVCDELYCIECLLLLSVRVYVNLGDVYVDVCIDVDQVDRVYRQR
jgi:hypothetical protein